MVEPKIIVHALKMGTPLNKLETKCGLRIRSNTSKRHEVAFNEAGATCVPCKAVVDAELKVKRYERGHVNPTHERYYDWADGPDSGISSKTIVQTITGARVLGTWQPGAPRDPDDFGRCSRLLALFPELRTRLHVVADQLGGEWRALVEHWDELEALYQQELPAGKAPRLYKLMHELAKQEVL